MICRYKKRWLVIGETWKLILLLYTFETIILPVWLCVLVKFKGYWTNIIICKGNPFLKCVVFMGHGHYSLGRRVVRTWSYWYVHFLHFGKVKKTDAKNRVWKKCSTVPVWQRWGGLCPWKQHISKRGFPKVNGYEIYVTESFQRPI